MTQPKLEITLSNGETDSFFNALRDAVKNRDLDLIQGGLQDIVVMANEIDEIDETEGACFEAYLEMAHIQVQYLIKKDKAEKEAR